MTLPGAIAAILLPPLVLVDVLIQARALEMLIPSQGVRYAVPPYGSFDMLALQVATLFVVGFLACGTVVASPNAPPFQRMSAMFAVVLGLYASTAIYVAHGRSWLAAEYQVVMPLTAMLSQVLALLSWTCAYFNYLQPVTRLLTRWFAGLSLLFWYLMAWGFIGFPRRAVYDPSDLDVSYTDSTPGSS